MSNKGEMKMKRLLLKVIIGIIAVPTVVLGAVVVTKDIPVVSKYVVAPMAKLSQNMGLPVIVIPSDNYFKEEAREVYDEAVRRYNMWEDKENMIIGETQATNHNADGVSIYQNYNVGVSYAELQIKPYEQFEKEWIEYSKEFYKNSKKPTQKEIDNYNSNIKDINAEMEKQQRLIELNQELQNAQMNNDNELAEQIQQQINELQQ